MESFSWDSRESVERQHVARWYRCSPRFDQHENGWCGACYLVSAVQLIEDRWNLLVARQFPKTRKPPRGLVTTLSIQAALDHYDADAAASEDADWNGCHGGDPLDVLHCFVTDGRLCRPQRRTGVREWLGHVQAAALGTPRADEARFRVTRAYRVAPGSVKEEIMTNGTVGLCVNGDLIAGTDANGVVPMSAALDAALYTDDHAVCVVGWHGAYWLVRNSWGARRPAAGPNDVSCASRGANECSTTAAEWSSVDGKPGFCFLPMVHPPLSFDGEQSPWFAATVAPKGPKT